MVAGAGPAVGVVLAVALATKLGWELASVWRPLSRVAAARAGLGVFAITAAAAGWTGAVAVVVLAAVLAGELLERHRFFTGASWTGMPGPKT
jgi:hypothetical protein